MTNTVMPDLTDHESVQSARYWDDVLQGNAGYYRYARFFAARALETAC